MRYIGITGRRRHPGRWTGRGIPSSYCFFFFSSPPPSSSLSSLLSSSFLSSPLPRERIDEFLGVDDGSPDEYRAVLSPRARTPRVRTCLPLGHVMIPGNALRCACNFGARVHPFRVPVVCSWKKCPRRSRGGIHGRANSGIDYSWPGIAIYRCSSYHFRNESLSIDSPCRFKRKFISCIFYFSYDSN